MGKVAAAVCAAAFAWVARRPAERAAILIAVDKRVETLMSALERQLKSAHDRCDAVEAKAIADRALCDEELADMRDEITKLMAGPVAEYTTLKRPLG